MNDFDRRSALALGLATAATAMPAAPRAAVAETYGPSYGPDDGRERAPGVRMVDVSRRESVVPAYKAISLRDIVYQPGTKTASPTMANDMVCHCLDGELHIDHGGGKQFVAKKGDVWSCAKGMPEAATNTGGTVAIMRVIDMLA